MVFPLYSELHYLCHLNYIIKRRLTFNQFGVSRSILSYVVFTPNLSVTKCIAKEIPTLEKRTIE